MRYKALILDLDGTTVPRRIDGMPSPGVTQAISQARNLIHVCVATGRPLSRAEDILRHLQLTGPCVINNGTQLYDPVKKVVLREVPLGQEFVKPIFAVLNEYKGVYYVFDGDNNVRFNGNNIPDKVFSMFVEDLSKKDVDEISGRLSGISGVATHKIVSWTPGKWCIDITNASATKLHGLVEIFKILEISHDEAIGVGDGHNDFPLLMACGLKVAMGNAVPELKEIADFIAPSVEDDGVAVVIEKYILSPEHHQAGKRIKV
jgi:5-amino-6-(5-phospho-D-ribitylamino)uracil phosphatase